MRKLGGLDAAFVYGETPSWHMNVGALLELDPATAPRPFNLERLRELLAHRLDLLGPFRQRLVAVPFGLARPYWVDDPDIDLREHVQACQVPAPGGRDELSTAVGELLARKLDRHRPLWEIWLLEGLSNGRVALLVKAHHSLFDGVAAMRLFQQLCDVEPDTPAERSLGRPPAGSESEYPSPFLLWSDAFLATATIPVRLIRGGYRLACSGVGLLRFRSSSQWHAATFPFQAPRTSLNGLLTPRRSFAFCSVPLEDAQAIKQTLGVTLNDVVLAVTAGALRRYLQSRGELPERPLVAQIPIVVSTSKGQHEHRTRGNALSVIGASLATQLDDPTERLRSIHSSTQSAKGMHHALGEQIVEELAELAPPALLARLIRGYNQLGLAMRHPPIFSLIVSNIRGAPCPLYVAGAQVIASYPIGPLLDGGGLNVSAMSYNDSLDFGLCVCPDIVSDPWQLADAATAAFAELREKALERA